MSMISMEIRTRGYREYRHLHFYFYLSFFGHLLFIIFYHKIIKVHEVDFHQVDLMKVHEVDLYEVDLHEVDL